jgi:hypothetical protein
MFLSDSIWTYFRYLDKLKLLRADLHMLTPNSIKSRNTPDIFIIKLNKRLKSLAALLERRCGPLPSARKPQLHGHPIGANRKRNHRMDS